MFLKNPTNFNFRFSVHIMEITMIYFLSFLGSFFLETKSCSSYFELFNSFHTLCYIGKKEEFDVGRSFKNIIQYQVKISL